MDKNTSDTSTLLENIIKYISIVNEALNEKYEVSTVRNGLIMTIEIVKPSVLGYRFIVGIGKMVDQCLTTWVNIWVGNPDAQLFKVLMSKPITFHTATGINENILNLEAINNYTVEEVMLLAKLS